MKRALCIGFLLGLSSGFSSPLLAHELIRARAPVRLPDLPGYRTLKCDFHIHTVFSDGVVWPTVRAEEAWREGLDAIAITDHLEYQPHKADVSTNHNRAFDIAQPAGEALQLTVIRGSEITRSMPPGHFNAIFLTNSALLALTPWREAFQEAKRQEAFIFWNHPGWTGQQSDGFARWYPEHTELLDGGMFQGIEVVNSREYYPEAHRWALEKDLAILSNSDIHNPLNLDYDVHTGDHRPLTLVFATDASPGAIREALFARRTAAYAGHRIIGRAAFLEPLFLESLRVLTPQIRIRGTQRVLVQIHNQSEVPYDVQILSSPDDLELPRTAHLAGGRTVLVPLTGTGKAKPGSRQLSIALKVTNLLTGPNQPLELTVPLTVEFLPE